MVVTRLKTVFAALCLATFIPAIAMADRLALIMGNDSYTHVPTLEKARNDATAMSATLEEIGFDVTRVIDADRREMNRAISGFVSQLSPGDTAVLFFAGHGVEIDGENYLLPTDIEAPTTASEDFIKYESIGLSDMLERVQGTGARTTLMFIDACRDNPFAASTGRSVGGHRGLALVTAPEGTFVVFSAGARQQALDRLGGTDEDPNSVFTRTLLPKLTQPGLELRQMVSQVRLEVRDLALQQNHQQFPAYYDELLGQFYFTRGTPVTLPPVAEVVAPGSTLQEDFERARSIDTVLAYETFLQKHGDADDLTIDMARLQLDRLREPSRTAALAPPLAPEPADTPPLAMARQEILRRSQERLNALGCSAGIADGVVGPRTRRAFRAFLAGSETSLTTDDLGSPAALAELEALEDIVCPDTTRQAAAAPQDQSVAQTPAAPPSLAGTWPFNASCPFFITSHGTTTYRATGGGTYALTTRDNLGNVATGTGMDTGDGKVLVRLTWQTGAPDNYTATLSPDRRTISGVSQGGCTFTARKD